MFERLKTIFSPSTLTRASPTDGHKTGSGAAGTDNGDSKHPDGLSPATDKVSTKKQGDEHLRSERLLGASECYRRALAIDPDYVDARVALGYALCEQKEHRAAADELRHALEIDSRNADAHYLLGTIARSANDSAHAIEHFTLAIDAQPDLEFAHRELIAVLFASGQIERTNEALRRAMSIFPKLAEFPFDLGNILLKEGDFDNAAACYKKALDLEPGSAQAHKGLGDALSKKRDLARAAQAYQKAIWFDPDFVEAHIALGSVMQTQGNTGQAAASYQRAVAIRPEHAGAQMGLGDAFEQLGRIDEAIACYRRAVAISPESSAPHQFLGNALRGRGDLQEAVECYKRVVALDPKNPVRHLLAAATGSNSERAPREYVEQLFDEYANKFDSHLVKVLSYNVPENLPRLLRPYYDPASGKWAILDLGCGTGLSGMAMAPYARQLVGVDVSAKMLDKARERKVYNRLEYLDMVTMMEGEAAASYDVVLAADVFVYMGQLDGLAAEVQRVLRPGGLFAFSVESLDAVADTSAALPDARGYELNVTGRYAHSIAYLDRLAAHNRFETLSTAGIHVRLHRGQPIQGYMVLWRRSAE
jgi:predicted TPR repeat methyltransferase